MHSKDIAFEKNIHFLYCLTSHIKECFLKETFFFDCLTSRMKITKIKELYFLREETFICFKYYARYKKVTRNFKLKEKYYVNEKTHLAI